MRVDREKQQPIREWDGAKTRNHMTLCNNLLPVQGGTITESQFQNVVDRYFNVQQKQVGHTDQNKVKVLSHDLKNLLKRFGTQESFSRDSKGGGPEHNMMFVPLLVQLITHCLKSGTGSSNVISHTEDSDHKEMTYVQEKRLAEFCEQGVAQKQAFLSKLEQESA